MIDTDRYDKFVGESPQGSIFATSWWLDAVAPATYGIASVENNGAIEAAWPYVIRHSWHGSRIEMPPLTPWLGILFSPVQNVKLAKRLGREKDLIAELVSLLPNATVIHARFHRNFQYWTPLQWLGFTETTRYTFVLDDVQAEGTSWDGFRSNIRGDVRKAQRAGVIVEETDDLRVFWDVHRLTFERQGLAVPYPFELVARIDNACARRGVRRMLVARDGGGRIHAGAYLVWDSRSVYYLIGGGDPALRGSGATALTLWESIKFAAGIAPVFDFEGSMLEPVERFVRAFGAHPEPYYAITKVNSRVHALYSACRNALTGNG